MLYHVTIFGKLILKLTIKIVLPGGNLPPIFKTNQHSNLFHINRYK